MCPWRAGEPCPLCVFTAARLRTCTRPRARPSRSTHTACLQARLPLLRQTTSRLLSRSSGRGRRALLCAAISCAPRRLAMCIAATTLCSSLCFQRARRCLLSHPLPQAQWMRAASLSLQRYGSTAFVCPCVLRVCCVCVVCACYVCVVCVCCVCVVCVLRVCCVCVLRVRVCVLSVCCVRTCCLFVDCGAVRLCFCLLPAHATGTWAHMSCF